MESHGCRPWSRMTERISRVAAKDFFRPYGAHATLKFPTTAFSRGLKFIGFALIISLRKTYPAVATV